MNASRSPNWSLKSTSNINLSLEKSSLSGSLPGIIAFNGTSTILGSLYVIGLVTLFKSIVFSSSIFTQNALNSSWFSLKYIS